MKPRSVLIQCIYNNDVVYLSDDKRLLVLRHPLPAAPVTALSLSRLVTPFHPSTLTPPTYRFDASSFAVSTSTSSTLPHSSPSLSPLSARFCVRAIVAVHRMLRGYRWKGFPLGEKISCDWNHFLGRILGKGSCYILSREFVCE